MKAEPKGYYWHKGNQSFSVQIRRNGKQYYVGSYTTEAKAAAAYQKAVAEQKKKETGIN